MEIYAGSKMSFKEVKDEYKNSEGDPHVKAALRQKKAAIIAKVYDGYGSRI